MILYIRDLNGFPRKLLDLINTSSKVAGYKINMQKVRSQKNLYIQIINMLRKKIRKTFLIAIAKGERKLGQEN